MKVAGDLTREQLVEVVEDIQLIMFGKYKTIEGLEIDFLDTDKEWEACDWLDSIQGVLDQFDLVPSFGSESVTPDGVTLHICKRCQFVYEASALHIPELMGAGSAPANGEDTAAGRCPRCGEPCALIPEAALRTKAE
jgi:hypothetical protein